ncbi:hypothetical protein [Cryptosporangium sp. NPDC048952]|uniref:hypothetical protein n=1 Tax=Cryptosporangium sp. NPDC048952 TaxID=3363961 RepID=UPI003722C644
MSQARHAIEAEPRYRAWMLAAATSMAVVAVGVGGAVFTLGGGGDSDVVSAANRYRPLAGWWQVEIEDRSGAGCLDPGCPMSVRRWQAERAPTAGELRKSIEAAGWSDPGVDGDCRPSGNRTGAFPLCTARASDDGMELTLTVQQADSYDVTLTVESR